MYTNATPSLSQHRPSDNELVKRWDPIEGIKLNGQNLHVTNAR